MLQTRYAQTAPILDATAVFAVVWSCSWPHAATARWLPEWQELAGPAAFALLWLVVASHIGVYRASPRHNLALAVRRTFDAWVTTWGIGGLVALTMLTDAGLAVWPALGLGLAVTTTFRCLAAFAPWWDDDSRLRTLVIGSSPSARALRQRNRDSGINLVGVVPFANELPADGVRRVGAVEDLPRILRDERVDVAVVTPSDHALTGEVRAAFRACTDQGVTVHYFPTLLDVDGDNLRISWQSGGNDLDVMRVTSPQRTLAVATKRAIDVLGAGLGVALLAPVFLGAALAVKLTSSGPVFYRQTRVGAGGRHFSCLKFRTMKVGADKQQELLRSASLQDGPAFKMARDPRLTPVGPFLRKYSIDELPQMLNVLLGDMSLVGPRPPIPSEVERYTWWQKRRVSVKPGLTCLWQVWGRNRVSFKRWVEMDLYYIDNWTLWMDLKLIAHTVRVVLQGTGM
jgi:exopolysaccharide biosynthesis polyprenyl glycosylphosphotransferase